MPYLVVSQDEPTLSRVDTIDDDLLEDAANGDVIIINEKFEKLDINTGMFLAVEERE